jgi:hypothetical protein
LVSGAEAQQQVIDAVQLDVEVLELRVEILPSRQAALAADATVRVWLNRVPAAGA